MNYKFTFLFFSFLIPLMIFSQEKALVKIKGFAPDYVGKSIEIYQIDDYFSMKETKLGAGEVQASDSTFSIVFFADETQKVRVRGANNQSFMYIEPNADYTIYFPVRDKFAPYRPAGNEVELTFYNLDTTDINYKILEFNRWSDKFVATQFGRHSINPVQFNQKMDTFKLNVQKYYAADTGKYIYDYVRYTIASLDNIQQAGNRNRYEKHDFYLKFNPVLYRNDAYMDYFTTFYSDMNPRLSMEANNRVYLGVLKSSPTMIMKALGLEYTLVNMRIREMVMIQSLSEAYFQDDFPQTNIITILDSVANHAMFEANKSIAANMIARLTEVVAGGRAPDFAMTNSANELKTLADFKKKHLYIHFFDPTSEKNTIEIPLLLEMYGKYLNDIEFITVIPADKMGGKSTEVLDQLPWEVFSIDKSNGIFQNYKIETFPSYVLIDPYAYIIAAPALGPQPNGQYETIDKYFFEIQKINKQLRGEE